MREIKFRAKAIEQFVDGDQWVYGFGVSVVKLTSGKSQCWMYTDNGTYEVDPETVGQYTGLQDKNGKDIYEGDILSTDLSRPYLIVEFRNGAFMHQCHDNGKDYYDFMLPSDTESNQDKYAEVIGNSFDNPNLLEG